MLNQTIVRLHQQRRFYFSLIRNTVDDKNKKSMVHHIHHHYYCFHNNHRTFYKRLVFFLLISSALSVVNGFLTGNKHNEIVSLLTPSSTIGSHHHHHHHHHSGINIRGGNVKTTLSSGKQQQQQSSSSDDLVNELLELINSGGSSSYSKKTPEQREQILSIMKQLEDIGSDIHYLDDPTFIGKDNDDDDDTTSTDISDNLIWDSYELAYFDRSIDGGRNNRKNATTTTTTNNNNDAYKNATRPFGIRNKILGSMFGLRYSFQHAVRPNRFINDVGFKIFGFPAAVVAGGNFSKVSQDDLNSIKNETGTILRSDTAIRIDFEEPIMWFGNKRFFPIIFKLGSKAQSPPVTLCTTYLDNKIRLALAAKGGRLIFTRGGKTKQSFANDWKDIVTKRPISGNVLKLTTLLGLSTLVSQVPATRVPVGAITTLFAAMFVKSKLSKDSKK